MCSILYVHLGHTHKRQFTYYRFSNLKSNSHVYNNTSRDVLLPHVLSYLQLCANVYNYI